MKLTSEAKLKASWRIREFLKISALFFLIMVAAMVVFPPAREKGAMLLLAGVCVTCAGVIGTYIFGFVEMRKAAQRLTDKRDQDQAYRKLF